MIKTGVYVKHSKSITYINEKNELNWLIKKFKKLPTTTTKML